MICKCPACGTLGERFAVGDYLINDETFKCAKCGFQGKGYKDMTLWPFLIKVAILVIVTSLLYYLLFR